MLEHIHCNKCFRLDPVKDISYWLTNCGHILCQQCLDHAAGAQRREKKKRRAGLDGNDTHSQENNSTNGNIVLLLTLCLSSTQK